jgi:hypothetical protein
LIRGREQDAVVAHPPQPLLPDGRAQQIATELLQTPAVGGRYGNIRVEIEARDVRVSRVARQNPWRVRLFPHLPLPPPRARPERDQALDRRGADARERRGFLRDRVRV